MIVKIKCSCGAERVVKKDTLKEARKVKRVYKKGVYVCEKCWFKMMANNTARQIIKENGYGYR